MNDDTMKNKKGKKMIAFSLMLLVLTSAQGTFVHAEKGESSSKYETSRHKADENEKGEYKRDRERYEDEEKNEGRHHEENGDDEGGDEDYGEHKGDGNAQDANSGKVIPSETASTPSPTSSSTSSSTPSIAASYADGETVSLQIQGLQQPIKVSLAVREGIPMVPAETILEQLRIPSVAYSKGTILEAYADERGRHFIFHTEKKVFFENGTKRSISTAPFVQGGRFYVPLNVLANELNYSVIWNPQTKSFDLRRGV